MKRPKIVWLSIAVLLLLACQFTNTFMPPASTATPVRARTRTPTPMPTTQLPPTIAIVPPIPTVPPAPITGVVTENLRVRESPSTSAVIVGRLNKGEQAQIVARTPASDWFQILLPTDPNARGWVSAEFITISVPADTIPLSGESTLPGGGPADVPPALPTPLPRPYP